LRRPLSFLDLRDSPGSERRGPAAGVNASTGSWVVSRRGFPTPWQITGGPRLAETMVDGRAWVFTLARGGRERQLTVVVSREAFKVDPPRLLPVQTREAIQTAIYLRRSAWRECGERSAARWRRARLLVLKSSLQPRRSPERRPRAARSRPHSPR
jgi:hypothetical protein